MHQDILKIKPLSKQGGGETSKQDAHMHPQSKAADI